MDDQRMRRVLRGSVLTGATVIGVSAVFLLAAAVQAGEQDEAVAEFSSEPTAGLPDIVAAAAEGDASCVSSDTALCLLKEADADVGRYEVTIALGAKEHFDNAPPVEDWKTCDVPAEARDPAFPCRTKVVQAGSRVIGTDDSGLFYFFDRNNWEVLIKVLNGCGTGLPNHWVYAASASDQGMQITVRDTTWTEAAAATGRVEKRVYNFPPIVNKEEVERPNEPGSYYFVGHPALTAAAETDAFPGVCPAPAASSDVADAAGEVDPEETTTGSS